MPSDRHSFLHVLDCGASYDAGFNLEDGAQNATVMCNHISTCVLHFGSILRVVWCVRAVYFACYAIALCLHVIMQRSLNSIMVASIDVQKWRVFSKQLGDGHICWCTGAEPPLCVFLPARPSAVRLRRSADCYEPRVQLCTILQVLPLRHGLTQTGFLTVPPSRRGGLL